MKIIAIITVMQLFMFGASHRIGMNDNEFSPRDLNVMPGDTVWWINQGAFPHTATSGTDGAADSVWDSGKVAPGDSFSFVFNLPPRGYDYFCAYHWQMGMAGTIIIGATDQQRGGEGGQSDTGNDSSTPNPY